MLSFSIWPTATTVNYQRIQAERMFKPYKREEIPGSRYASRGVKPNIEDGLLCVFGVIFIQTNYL